MNKTPPAPPRNYEAIVKTAHVFINLPILAKNRREAVTKALNWFWYEYRGTIGTAHKAMIVTDPYSEVHYGPRFTCSDRRNKLLPHEVSLRVIKESNGELELDTREGIPNHAPGSVKRIKRRRDFGKFVAPCIRKMKSGAMYYRITIAPQHTLGEQVIRKRKYKDIRLKSRNLVAAIDEIKLRGLLTQNQAVMKRNMKVRDLTLMAHVAGHITASVLTDDQKLRFSKFLGRIRIKAA